MLKEGQSIYVCEECGGVSIQWLGRCPSCGSYGTMREERNEKKDGKREKVKVEALRMGDVSEDPARVTLGIEELDRVLGGGAVPGSLVLVGGEPGIGKSTLLLQAGASLAGRGVNVLMVSGEESAAQITSRARRIGIVNPDLYLVCETDLEAVIAAARELKPSVLMVDSLQTMRSPDIDSVPGGINQMRECVCRLQALAKDGETVVFLVGHVTKEGILAGPRVVEHMVDSVLYFEGERFGSMRILRAVKNRFGSVSELGIFEMSDSGLREVKEPSLHFLGAREEAVPGTAAAVVMEGRRPLVVEVQSLVTPSRLPSPKRVSTGIDQRRLAINVAVLERKAGIRLEDRDVYVGISGGLKITEPALDLGVCMAIASSLLDRTWPLDKVFLGEVSLTGEVRSVSRLEERAGEAARMGFKYLVLSNKGDGRAKGRGLELLGVKDVSQALEGCGVV
ncbi:MAG: DNA repair protein RadA [Actinomycetota bacterium]